MTLHTSRRSLRGICTTLVQGAWQRCSALLATSQEKRDASLFFSVDADTELRAYSDSDYAACLDTRRSRTGIAITYAVDLGFEKNVLQNSVTLSTSEADYMAVGSYRSKVGERVRPFW